MMELANDLYNYDLSRTEGNNEAAAGFQKAILEAIRANSMCPLYTTLCEKYNWALDKELVDSMRTKNTSDLMEITLKIEDAVKNAGDTEVIEGYFQQGKHQAAIGDFLAANATFDLILSKPKATTGKRIDSYMEQAKIALFCLDTKALKGILASAKVLNESGGDWDRRNRLKIYEAFYLLAIRDVAGASQLLLDCVATFTCTELASYKDFMFLLLVTALISLDRNQLRDKLIKDPHVITTSRELPIASKLVHSIYQCKYTAYFESILALSQELSRNRFLGPLAAYLIREYRVLAYRQFLEAYQSVMLSSMAAQFGISVQLLDQELSRFIASGRLNAKIDKVGDIVETLRPDSKNAQYHEVIKKGDALLNHIQKLVRAIDV